MCRIVAAAALVSLACAGAAGAATLAAPMALRLARRHEAGRVHWVYGASRAEKIVGSARVTGCTVGLRDRAARCAVVAGRYAWTDDVMRWGPCSTPVVAPGVARGTTRGLRGCDTGPLVVLSRGLRRS